MADGLQLAPTNVIVEVAVLPLPPPHATDNSRQPTATRVPRNRTLSPLLDLADIDALWNHRRKIGAAMEVACVSARLEDESGGLDRHGTVSMALLEGDRLLHGFEVGTQQLLHVRLKWAFPCDRKDGAVGGNEFAHDLSGGNLDFVGDVVLRSYAAQRALHMRFVGLDSGHVVAQRRPSREGQRQQHAWQQHTEGPSVGKSKGSASIH